MFRIWLRFRDHAREERQWATNVLQAVWLASAPAAVEHARQPASEGPRGHAPRLHPAAFTCGCTAEMCAVRDAMDAFNDRNAPVYGVSVDLPFAQNIWIREETLNVPGRSDWNHDSSHQYTVVLEEMDGLVEAVQRSSFVIGTQGTVTSKWVREGDTPDFEELVSVTRDAVATATAHSDSQRE